MQLVTGTVNRPRYLFLNIFSTNLDFLINFNELIEAYFTLQVISQLFQMAEDAITFFTFTGNLSITIIYEERKQQ